jgi:hypothetical protein
MDVSVKNIWVFRAVYFEGVSARLRNAETRPTGFEPALQFCSPSQWIGWNLWGLAPFLAQRVTTLA